MNKLCCLVDPYLKCLWCEAKLCDACARGPLQDITCIKSLYASNKHKFMGDRILRSMPLRIGQKPLLVHPDEFYKTS